MATSTITQSTLQLVFQNGLDPLSGEPVFQTKSFNNVKSQATPAQLYNIAIAFEGLQERPLESVGRRDTSDIRPA
ncbi:DUF1659 domain-containing protein [Oceanobacillus sp. CAU 1775]